MQKMPDESTLEVLKLDDRIRAVAHAMHEANRAYCKLLGDDSQSAWEWTPLWQQESAILGAIGFLYGSTPEESHAGWLEHKIKTGWVYGTKKNPDAVPPTHPCMVPYEQLPASQRLKDSIVHGVARTMLGALGMLPVEQTEVVAA